MNKTIKLGSREFVIPELAIRQRRVVVPLGIKLRPVMQRIKEQQSIDSLTTEEYTDIQEVVYQGITRGEPKLEREAFLGFCFDEVDLIHSFGVVISQAGFKQAEESESGEAHGEMAKSLSPQTGTNTTPV